MQSSPSRSCYLCIGYTGMPMCCSSLRESPEEQAMVTGLNEECVCATEAVSLQDIRCAGGRGPRHLCVACPRGTAPSKWHGFNSNPTPWQWWRWGRKVKDVPCQAIYSPTSRRRFMNHGSSNWRVILRQRAGTLHQNKRFPAFPFVGTSYEASSRKETWKWLWSLWRYWGVPWIRGVLSPVCCEGNWTRLNNENTTEQRAYPHMQIQSVSFAQTNWVPDDPSPCSSTEQSLCDLCWSTAICRVTNRHLFRGSAF